MASKFLPSGDVIVTTLVALLIYHVGVATIWHRHNSLKAQTSPVALRDIPSPPQNSSQLSATDAGTIPQVYHCILMGKQEIKFYEYLSLKSVQLYANPETIYVHTDTSLKGEWWEKVQSELNVTVRPIVFSVDTIAGKNVEYGAHKSDLTRLLVLALYGGLYTDTDVWLLPRAKTIFEDYGEFPLIMGCEDDECQYVTNAAILAGENSPMIAHWYESYGDDYRPDKFSYNGVHVMSKLSDAHPGLLHLDKHTWMRPNYREIRSFVNPSPDNDPSSYKFNFSENYMIHWWHKGPGIALDKLLPGRLAEKAAADLSPMLALAKSIYEAELS